MHSFTAVVIFDATANWFQAMLDFWLYVNESVSSFASPCSSFESHSILFLAYVVSSREAFAT